MYEPRADELSERERWFLAKVAPLGLDFLTTRQRYQERFGVSSYHGWKDVVALPASRALTEVPLVFAMYADEDLLDLAPEYLFADYMPHDDALANHRDMEQQLTAALGVPEVRDVSNCIQRLWSFGIFRVELHTFPPELQAPSLNVLHEKNPRLALNASVTIHSDYAFPYPDGSLDAVAEALELGRPSALELPISAGAAGWPQVGTSRRHTRRCSRRLAAAAPRDELCAWRDDAQRSLGLTATQRALVFDQVQAKRLCLTTQQPDRGPAGLQLELELATAGAPVTLLEDYSNATQASPLRACAERLAQLWQLELAHVTYDGW